jgi:hypothetical protein
MRAHFGLPSVKNGQLNRCYVTILLKRGPISVRSRRRKTCSYNGEIRDPIFHSVGYPSAIPQDRRKERVSGVTVGEVYNTKW